MVAGGDAKRATGMARHTDRAPEGRQMVAGGDAQRATGMARHTDRAPEGCRNDAIRKAWPHSRSAGRRGGPWGIRYP